VKVFHDALLHTLVQQDGRSGSVPRSDVAGKAVAGKASKSFHSKSWSAKPHVKPDAKQPSGEVERYCYTCGSTQKGHDYRACRFSTEAGKTASRAVEKNA